ncbi:3-dehydroquinate synthase, partial [Candidatus Roizmanbacteria bacterium CG_4_8_14_3_um_filter_35_14]
MRVIIDVKTLKTLPKRELISAFGEIIKHGVISGQKHFDLVTSKKPEEFNQRELIKIIKQSIKIKSNIVQKDPKEKDLRKVLNFGHTIGHAIESLSWKTDSPLLHGEAVAIGIV